MERERWISREGFSGNMIYNTPNPPQPKIHTNHYMFVINMYNKPKLGFIQGYSIVKNRRWYDTEIFRGRRFNDFNVYTDSFYNRCTYLSDFYIPHTSFTTYEKNLTKILEEKIFKGKGHLKRGQGFTTVPQKRIDDNILKLIHLFVDRFTNEQHISIDYH